MPSRLEACVARQSFAPAIAGLKLRRVELGESLLLVGAAELAFQSLLADPMGTRLWLAQQANAHHAVPLQ